MPVEGVLGLQYPVVLVREHYQPGRYAHELCCVVCRHPFVQRDAEVHAAVCHEDRRMPFCNHVMRGHPVVPHCLRCRAPRRPALADASECLPVAGRSHRAIRSARTRVCPVFVETSVVPVREPHLFGSHVHVLFVEYPGMRYESIEDIAVNPAEVVYGVAAVAGPACGHLPDVRLGLERTCRHEVVLHVQARVVARYLLCPFLPERCGAASVGQYGHISLRRHQTVVPPVGPSLAERALRPSQADEDGRIFLAAVEMRRIDHPCEHVLPVHCLYVPRFCLHGVELREYGVIHMCYLADVHRLRSHLAFCRKRGAARDLKRGGRYSASVGSSGLVPDPDAYQLGREVHAAVVGQQGSYSVIFRYMERRIEVIPQVLAGDSLYVPG